MNLHEEIAKVANELYQKSGCIDGRDFENWLAAESIVLTIHASQDIEEPEGEELIIMDEGLIEEVEGKAPAYARQNKEEDTSVVEGIEVQSPAIGTEGDIAIRTDKIRPAKPATAKGKKCLQRKQAQKAGKSTTKNSQSDESRMPGIFAVLLATTQASLGRLSQGP